MLSHGQFLHLIEQDHPNWACTLLDVFWMVTLTTLIGPITLLFREGVYSFYNSSNISYCKRFLMDGFSLLLPISLTFTISSDHTIPLQLALVLVSFPSLYALKKHSPMSHLDVFPFHGKGLPFLNSYRAIVNLCTIIVILAVDFPQIFPQKHHKRYTSGFSLMDTGVGSFIFSHALVAPEARNKDKKVSLLSRIRECLVSSSMLLALGCGRLFVTWITNYSVSEEEYGKHWNFFFTLACVKLFITVILSTVPHKLMEFPSILALCIGVGYQVLLSYFGFKDWIIIGDNKDGSYSGNFIHANRPGLFSTIGYCSLYLFGVEIGRLIFCERALWKDEVKLSRNLSLIVMVCGMLTSIFNLHVDKCSRMIANLTFVIWQVMHNTALLFGSHLVDMVCATFSNKDGSLVIPGHCELCTDRKSIPSCSCLLSAINKNQLFFFLIGNVLTGLVNLSIKTGNVSEAPALLIILSYSMVVCGITCMIFVYKVKTKFW